MATDVAGPFAESQMRNLSFLITIDNKWREACGVRNVEASKVSSVLVATVFCRFGVPRELYSD
jgi:hypothetical protein